MVLRGWPIAGLYEEFERLRSGTFGALHERVEARPRKLRIGRVRVKPLGRVGTAAAAAGRDPAEIRRIYNRSARSGSAEQMVSYRDRSSSGPTS